MLEKDAIADADSAAGPHWDAQRAAHQPLHVAKLDVAHGLAVPAQPLLCLASLPDILGFVRGTLDPNASAAFIDKHNDFIQRALGGAAPDPTHVGHIQPKHRPQSIGKVHTTLLRVAQHNCAICLQPFCTETPDGAFFLDDGESDHVSRDDRTIAAKNIYNSNPWKFDAKRLGELFILRAVHGRKNADKIL